jgi:hypothetical protein
VLSIQCIIAGALLRELAGRRFEVFGAEDAPAARVHPLTLTFSSNVW